MQLWSLEDLGREGRGGLCALRAQLRGIGLDPASIAAAPRPVVLVDLVWSGGTLGVVQELLVRWAEEEGVDPAARFAAALAAQPEMWERWLRRLVAELRAGCAAGRREERRGAVGRRWVRRGGPHRTT